MKILIIGNGFLATEIAQKLQSEGHEILIFARTRSARIQSQQILGNIFDFEEFTKVFDWKPQVVIHTAWITTPGVYKNDLSNLRYAEFTIKLAKFVLNSDLEHLIVLGTCAEYGYQNAPSWAVRTELAPTSLYAQQKVVAFNHLNKLMQDSDVRLTWARIFHPYGPYQDEKRLIPLLIKSLKDRNPIVLADTTSVYDWITTRDVSSAISWILKSDLPMEIDVGTSFGFSNLELLRTLEKLLQIELPQSPQKVHHPGRGEVFIVDKRSALLSSGWAPKDTLTSGLEWVLGR
jgi:nucleoside-diphosphate-sugar epimerase